MNDQDVTVKLSLMNNIIGYLGTRPYGEVFQIVQAIQEQSRLEPKTQAVSCFLYMFHRAARFHICFVYPNGIE